MTNYITYHTEESKAASIIEKSMYSSHLSSLWKRISLRLFLKLDFDIWRTSQDKLFEILTPILEKDLFRISILERLRK